MGLLIYSDFYGDTIANVADLSTTALLVLVATRVAVTVIT